jgi:hypothetical protein
MPDEAQLRELAARMLALAMQAKDQDLLEWLCIRAGDYLDQATGLPPTPQAAPGVQQPQRLKPDEED